ncbi:hypothetical protein FACS1894219_10190 [Clostridia bacterium]|nr:hypothetical protein FACS1894219_10190 [Clostridia bacterium]
MMFILGEMHKSYKNYEFYYGCRREIMKSRFWRVVHTPDCDFSVCLVQCKYRTLIHTKPQLPLAILEKYAIILDVVLCL